MRGGVCDSLTRAVVKNNNDGTERETMWRRYDGNEWEAFDALPPRTRQRMREHAYDAWAVNALMLWRRYRRLHPTGQRAEAALLRYLDHCERLERQAFSDRWTERFRTVLPHEAAGASVLRYGETLAPVRRRAIG